MPAVEVERRVLVVAEDALARAGLAALLAGQPGVTVVGQCDAGPELDSLLDAVRPEVVVWDLGWEPAVSLERLAEMGDALGAVVALLSEEAVAPEAWAAGARGLLGRETDGPRLAAAIEAVALGLAAIDPALSEPPLGGPQAGDGSPLEPLTPRELEVLGLLAEGLTNKAIAGRLGVSEHTVKFHVNALLRKLGAQSRTEAVVRATRRGLILL